MDRFELFIKLGNEAMQKPEDVAAALRAIAEEIERTPSSRWILRSAPIYDANGNGVGRWNVE